MGILGIIYESTRNAYTVNDMKRRSKFKVALSTALCFSMLCLPRKPVSNFSSTKCLAAEELICKNSKVKNIGLMLTKDDGSIIYEWVKHSKHFFTGMVVLDGSTTSNIARKIFDRKNNSSSTFYYHESDFKALHEFSDSELREMGQKLVTSHFGYGVWVTMVHSDEFYLHNPLKVIEKAENEGADHVKWRALHVLPHVSEYENYLKNSNAPVSELFHHYYHYGPKGSFLENRMFRNTPGLKWEPGQGNILPRNMKKVLSLYPAYLHYKVHNLSLSAYTEEGIHKQHWNKVTERSYKSSDAKRGVGIRWSVKDTRDFFVDHFPNSHKYKYISKLGEDGSIESYLDIDESFKGFTAC